MITISFSRLDVEDTGNCVADSVSVFDGADTTSRLLGKFCGDELPPHNLTSSSHYVYVVFRSNHKRNVGAFALRWTASDAHGTEHPAAGTVCRRASPSSPSLRLHILIPLSHSCLLCLQWMSGVV